MNEYSKLNKHLAEGRAHEELKNRSILEHGSRRDLPLFYRYVVLETIFDPSIIDDNKISYFEHVLGVSNSQFASVLPRNTIIARRVLDTNSSASAPAMFLFPFFPSTLSLPCQPGEHVWVMFENPSGTKNDLGYWMCRITEPGFVDDVNHTHAPRANDSSFSPGIQEQFDEEDSAVYEFRNGRSGVRDGSRYTIAESATLPGAEDAYEKLINETDGGKLSTLEAIPRYRKRPGDTAFEGSNNTLIVLGKDRNGAVAKYTTNAGGRMGVDALPDADMSGPSAGAIDIVAGRGQTDATSGISVDSKLIAGGATGFSEVGKSKNETTPGEGDPDFKSDRSRIYVAQRTKVDENFNLKDINQELGKGIIQGGDPTKKDIKDEDRGDGAIVIKSDKVRLIARSDVEIIVTGFAKRDDKGNIVESENDDDFAVIAIKANGDIIFRPSKKGYIKLGGDDAMLGILCTDVPVTAIDGLVQGPPITTTMGGMFGGSVGDKGALAPGQGRLSARVLIK